MNRPVKSDGEVVLAARMIRQAFDAVPKHKRNAVLNQLSDIFEKPKTPHRGGPVLTHVVQLFMQDRRTEWTVRDIMAILTRQGVISHSNSKPLYNAMTYLQRMNAIRKVGYGRYQLIDGRFFDGLPPTGSPSAARRRRANVDGRGPDH